ncbi:MAG: hypothetical protein JEZ11_24640 [Desulfobacterales bacterium]|nr:hypothetical protein [Desulfobacterales bacterium]
MASSMVFTLIGISKGSNTGEKMLTPSEVEIIATMIKQRVGISFYMSTGHIMPDLDLKTLRMKGFISGDPGHAITDAYVYGILSAMDPHLADAPFSAIKAAMDAFPLSELEIGAITWLNTNAAIYCQGLGNTIEATTRRIIHDSTKELAMKGTIQKVLVEGTKERQTRSTVVTLLRRATEEVQRDWHRIVNTEMHSARTQGTAQGLRRQFGDNTTVIVRPHPDCCDLCRTAYTPGGAPRVFNLNEISALTNPGRTVAELRKNPGLPALHPHCMCEVVRFDPTTQAFDKDGRIVFRRK